jgi:hypothetical protein
MMARTGRDARRSGTPSPRGFARKQSKKDMQTAPKGMNFLFRRARLAISRGRISAGRLSAVRAHSEAKEQVEQSPRIGTPLIDASVISYWLTRIGTDA